MSYLESEFAPLWGSMGAVAEAFGVAYAGAKAVDKAIDWFRTALGAEDGTASLRAVEQLGDQLVRRGEKRVDADAARKDIEDGIAQLERLAMQPTIVRESLLGSAYKRLTMVEWRTGRKKEAQTALDAVVAHYSVAEAMALKADADNLYYPAKNCISAELRASFIKKRLPHLANDRMQVVTNSLQKTVKEKPDFWSVVGQTELLILAALAKGQLAIAEPGLTSSLRKLKARIPAVWMWDSVYNEAQFTLLPYLQMAGTSEKHAAHSLLDVLKELAAA